MVFYCKRFNRAGLAAEKLIGRLLCAIDVDDSVPTLLQRADTAIAHMREMTGFDTTVSPAS
jgi:hypothetical protein